MSTNNITNDSDDVLSFTINNEIQNQSDVIM